MPFSRCEEWAPPAPYRRYTPSAHIHEAYPYANVHTGGYLYVLVCQKCAVVEDLARISSQQQNIATELRRQADELLNIRETLYDCYTQVPELNIHVVCLATVAEQFLAQRARAGTG